MVVRPEALLKALLTLNLTASYKKLQERLASNDPTFQMTPINYLVCSAEASKSSLSTPTSRIVTKIILGAVTAIMTNPIWVVKVRMFTTSPDSPSAYRGLIRAFALHKCGIYTNTGTDGLTRIYHEEGPRGWWKGTSMALFGVSSGALQFMFYEEMKKRAFSFQKARKERDGAPWDQNKEKLVRKISGCLLERKKRVDQF